MNLNSLPSEMVQSVLKYVNPVSLVRIRKLSTRCNIIAQKAGLAEKLSVFNFIIEGQYRHPRMWKIIIFVYRELILEYGLNNMKCVLNYDIHQTNIAEALEVILERVQIRQQFELLYAHFTDEICKVMCQYGNSLRDVQSIHLKCVDVLCESASLAKFVSLCKSANDIDIENCCMVKNLLNAEVLGNRRWDAICITDSVSTYSLKSSLNDDLLLNVIINCKNFNIRRQLTETSFTAEGIVKFVKIMLEQRKGGYFCSLGSLEASLRDVTDRLVAIDPDRIQVYTNVWNYGTECKVKIDSATGESTVLFNIPENFT